MKLRAGTRKSPLAMAQTYMVLDMIKAAFPERDTEIVTFTTKGDRQLDRPLDKIGGKGVFVTEIEQALQSGEIDFAVHSAKDLPVTLGEGLEISGVCPRGNYRDMLVTKKALYLTIVMFSLLAQEVSVDVEALQGFILTQSLLI